MDDFNFIETNNEKIERLIYEVLSRKEDPQIIRMLLMKHKVVVEEPKEKYNPFDPKNWGIR